MGWSRSAASRVLLAWLWKLGQPSCTALAVEPVCRVPAEPQRPAPFTYLQVQAQILHSIPFQRRRSPRQASRFSAVEWAYSGCCGAELLWGGDSTALLPMRSAHLSVGGLWLSYLGKSSAFTPSMTRRASEAFSSAPVRFRDTRGSFKVIAFDKQRVNTLIFLRYSFNLNCRYTAS